MKTAGRRRVVALRRGAAVCSRRARLFLARGGGRSACPMPRQSSYRIGRFRERKRGLLGVSCISLLGGSRARGAAIRSDRGSSRRDAAALGRPAPGVSSPPPPYHSCFKTATAFPGLARSRRRRRRCVSFQLEASRPPCRVDALAAVWLKQRRRAASRRRRRREPVAPRWPVPRVPSPSKWRRIDANGVLPLALLAPRARRRGRLQADHTAAVFSWNPTWCSRRTRCSCSTTCFWTRTSWRPRTTASARRLWRGSTRRCSSPNPARRRRSSSTCGRGRRRRTRATTASAGSSRSRSCPTRTGWRRRSGCWTSGA